MQSCLFTVKLPPGWQSPDPRSLSSLSTALTRLRSFWSRAEEGPGLSVADVMTTEASKECISQFWSNGSAQLYSPFFTFHYTSYFVLWLSLTSYTLPCHFFHYPLYPLNSSVFPQFPFYIPNTAFITNIPLLTVVFFNFLSRMSLKPLSRSLKLLFIVISASSECICYAILLLLLSNIF